MRQQHRYYPVDRAGPREPISYKEAASRADFATFGALYRFCALLCVPVLILKLTLIPAIPWVAFPLILFFGPFVIAWILLAILFVELI